MFVRPKVGAGTAGEASLELFRKPGGRLVVWCHSTGRTADQAAPTSPTYLATVHAKLLDLADAGYCVIGADLGLAADSDGGTDKFGATGVDAYIDRLVAYARSTSGMQASSAPFVLIGHSQGPFTALNYASRHPERVAAIVAMASGTDGDNLAANGFAAQLNAAYGGSWATNGNPSHDPIDLAAALAARRIPIAMWAGATDAVIPLTGAGSQAAFAAAYGPLASVTTVAGSHTGMIANVPTGDLVNWVRANAPFDTPIQPAGYDVSHTARGWMQYEPVQAAADVATTSTTFQRASTLTGGSGVPILSFVPASPTVVIYLNAVWCGSAANTLVRACWLDVDNAYAIVAGTRRVVQSGNIRTRYDHIAVLTGLIPGRVYNFELGLAGDGTHAGGIRVGTDHHVMAVAVDGGVGIIANELGAREQSTPGDAVSGGNMTSTSLIQFTMTGGIGALNLPTFTPLPSGLTMVTMGCTFCTATSTSVDTAIGLWDNDAAAAVAGGDAMMCGGATSQRTICHYRKIFTGLAGTARNWSLGCKLIQAGTNLIVAKPGPDADEGPFYVDVVGLAA